MTKSLIFLTFLLSFFGLQAKGVLFPDVSYAYASVYYYNVEDIQQRPVTHIYTKQDGWADGYQIAHEKLPMDDVKKISTLLSKGIDGLQLGLSGCFIPHHGIVYFNEKDEPVASMSICLECEGARFWSINKGVYRTKATKLNEKVVSNQLVELQQIFAANKVTIFDNPNDYVKLSKMNKNPQVASMTINDSLYVAKLIGDATIATCKMWSKDNHFVQDTIKKYTAGGDKYEFVHLTEGSNKLLFDGKGGNAKLSDAKLLTPDIQLANGIKVGDSLDQVMNTFLVYDGISNPQSITVVGDIYKIVYTFESEILKSIIIGYK